MINYKENLYKIKAIKPNKKRSYMYSLIEIKEIKSKVLQSISEGKSLNEIQKTNGIPDSNIVYTWLNKDKEFKDNYTHARQEQAMFYAEKIESTISTLKASTEKSRELTDIARLEIDSYKWIASKLLPKVYGSNQNQTNIQVNVSPVTGMQIIDED